MLVWYRNRAARRQYPQNTLNAGSLEVHVVKAFEVTYAKDVSKVPIWSSPTGGAISYKFGREELLFLISVLLYLGNDTRHGGIAAAGH